MPPAAITAHPDGRFALTGEWTVHGLASVAGAVSALSAGRARLVVDASGIEAMDTAGALLLVRLARTCERDGVVLSLEGLASHQRALFDLVWQVPEAVPATLLRRPGPVEQVGRDTLHHLQQGLDLLAFLGEAVTAVLRTWARPDRIRWRALLAVVQGAGVNAIPIVALLSFLIGIVIAYQGGVQLKSYGANIFVVDLVALTMLRELGPMMTAIIVAGRTGSAYTAEIGTMMVTEEVDALRTMGISPMELLVLPKMFGLIIALPLLTMLADIAGVFGGMVMASALLGVDFYDFIARMPVNVTATSFLIGIGKAPFFAAIVALVGCFQGFQVSGGAESVGQQTTVSVVQAIFLVIVANAGFSIIFSTVGI